MNALKTLSLGGGVQSSTLVEMMVVGELPAVDFVIFADTGDEPAHVYQAVWYLAGRLASINVPTIVVSGGDMVADLYGGKRFAAMPLFTKQHTKTVPSFWGDVDFHAIGRLKRQCTSEYKITPIERFVKRELLARGEARLYADGRIYVNKGVMVEVMLGISLDEAERMKPSQNKWMVNRWPLIDRRMTRQGCINWLKERGLPIPQKSSCKRCPYHDDAYWLEMKQSRPADWAEVVQFDADLRDGDKLRLAATAKGQVFLHQSCIPLADVVFEPKQNLPVEICDEGYCGVFL